MPYNWVIPPIVTTKNSTKHTFDQTGFASYQAIGKHGEVDAHLHIFEMSLQLEISVHIEHLQLLSWLDCGVSIVHVA